jgi:methylmalonyl-CoA/ethylmalonyl-CoA epimerase
VSRFRFQHLGLAVPDLQAAIRVHEELFGCRLLSGPFDDPIQQARVAFVGTGEAGGLTLEFVAPLDDKSHVARLLAKGVGAYHICCEVDHLDETMRELRSRGCLIVREPAAAVAYQGRRIGWFYTPTRQLMELVESGN